MIGLEEFAFSKIFKKNKSKKEKKNSGRRKSLWAG